MFVGIEHNEGNNFLFEVILVLSSVFPLFLFDFHRIYFDSAAEADDQGFIYDCEGRDRGLIYLPSFAALIVTDSP
jgi:hypothetical protein